MSTRLDFSTLTLMDSLDLAILIEVEAHRRYTLFAELLGYSDRNDPGFVFAGMATNEAKHGQQLAERRQAMFGDAAGRVTLDDVFDVEAPEMGAPSSNMSALQAFQVALSSEQKAHDFYDEALGHITDPEIVALFTELRDEETEHVRMVEQAIAGLPPAASQQGELDPDESPYL